jgi:predicted DNA-binding antitoxin AbrB/MazE fold protein
VGEDLMPIDVDAIYENGVLKLKRPVDLPEKAEVHVTIEAAHGRAAEDDPTGWKAARRFIGLWKDAPKDEHIAREHDKHLYK